MPRVKLTLRDKILNLLDQHPDTEYNAKTIARKLRENYSSVRKELRRMVDLKLIDNPHYGFYRSKNVIVSSKGVVYPTPQVHGIKLEYKGDCHTFKTESFLATMFARYTTRRHPKNGSIVINSYPYIEGEQRDITITIHDNLLEIWVKTSDKPLTPQGLMELSAWLQGKFNLDPSQFKLTQIGLNYDFPGLKLDGMQSLTLKQFSNALIRIYQHGNGVRYEIHKSDKREDAITMEQAISILKYGIEGKRGDEEEYSELKRMIEEVNHKLDLLKEGMTTILKVENSRLNGHFTESKEVVEGYA